jgi:hypothetical protein
MIYAKKYDTISHGLHKNNWLIAFFRFKGIMSIFASKRIILATITKNIVSHVPFQNKNVQNIKIVRKRIDSFSHQYGIL